MFGYWSTGASCRDVLMTVDKTPSAARECRQGFLGRTIMGRFGFGACLVTALALSGSATSFAAPNATKPQSERPDGDREKPDERRFEPFKPEAVTSTGTVTVGGQAISYQAIAGTLIVHPKDWDDVPRDPKADKASPAPAEEGAEARNPTAEASMFYAESSRRPTHTRQP